jgi:hypothetical protein
MRRLWSAAVIAAAAVMTTTGVWANDASTPVPRYDVDGACAAYVDAGLAWESKVAPRTEAISSCVAWEHQLP